jgi:hypothetical protein
MTGLFELVINSGQLAYASDGACSQVRLPASRLRNPCGKCAKSKQHQQS